MCIQEISFDILDAAPEQINTLISLQCHATAQDRAFAIILHSSGHYESIFVHLGLAVSRCAIIISTDESFLPLVVRSPDSFGFLLLSDSLLPLGFLKVMF